MARGPRVARPAIPFDMLAAHLRFAELDGHVVVLDLPADRYRRLSRELSRIVLASQDGLPHPDEFEQLTAFGLLDPSGPGRPYSPAAIACATEEALGDTAAMPLAGFSLAAFSSLIMTRRTLATRGFASMVARAERLSQQCNRTNTPLTARIARDFERTRNWFPGERRCLPDGLALHALLARQRLRSTLVIGIRDQPFAAHCWVQSGGCVLTDTRDMIAELTPILVI